MSNSLSVRGKRDYKIKAPNISSTDRILVSTIKNGIWKVKEIKNNYKHFKEHEKGK